MAHESDAREPNLSADELLQAAETVARTGRKRVVHLDGKAIALVPQAVRARSRRKAFARDDPLWDMVGMFKADGGPTDVSDNADKHLAEAYLDTHE